MSSIAILVAMALVPLLMLAFPRLFYLAASLGMAIMLFQVQPTLLRPAPALTSATIVLAAK